MTKNFLNNCNNFYKDINQLFKDDPEETKKQLDTLDFTKLMAIYIGATYKAKK